MLENIFESAKVFSRSKQNLVLVFSELPLVQLNSSCTFMESTQTDTVFTVQYVLRIAAIRLVFSGKSVM